MATSVSQSEAHLVIAGSSAASVSAPATRFYRPELDGLRFVAILVVFVHHAFPEAAGDWRSYGFGDPAANWIAAATTAGGHGVDLFFALSSYLVTELLLREQDRFGELSLWRFWVRRNPHLAALLCVPAAGLRHRSGLSFSASSPGRSWPSC